MEEEEEEEVQEVEEEREVDEDGEEYAMDIIYNCYIPYSGNIWRWFMFGEVMILFSWRQILTRQLSARRGQPKIHTRACNKIAKNFLPTAFIVQIAKLYGRQIFPLYGIFF